jgi:uncharacterized protein Yka (UPF0111/DUF47 family)
MKAFKKIQDYILPHEVDFFKRLQEQSILTKKIIEELYNIYITKSSLTDVSLKNMIQQAQDMRKKNLNELYQVFLTPVDKEAISRAYINLDWVVMSVEHMEAELGIYEIKDLAEYYTIFDLLKKQVDEIHSGFSLLHKKDFDNFSKCVFNIVHYDNKIIEEYAHQVSVLLKGSEFKKIIILKDVLMQLKEISKRIRMCANDLEDMLFKMG